jgi:hypothetical protein
LWNVKCHRKEISTIFINSWLSARNKVWVAYYIGPAVAAIGPRKLAKI